MSRHFAAYFAIVGTLAFAPSGAANAGPFNMPRFNMAQPHFNMAQPHFNMAQPHFNMLRPQISMPTHLSNMPPQHLSNSQNSRPQPERPRGSTIPALHGPTGQPVTQQQSTPGTTSGNLSSNVSGGAVAKPSPILRAELVPSMAQQANL